MLDTTRDTNRRAISPALSACRSSCASLPFALNSSGKCMKYQLSRRITDENPSSPNIILPCASMSWRNLEPKIPGTFAQSCNPCDPRPDRLITNPLARNANPSIFVLFDTDFNANQTGQNKLLGRLGALAIASILTYRIFVLLCRFFIPPVRPFISRQPNSKNGQLNSPGSLS
jgi:hypothetical protein